MFNATSHAKIELWGKSGENQRRGREGSPGRFTEAQTTPVEVMRRSIVIRQWIPLVGGLSPKITPTSWRLIGGVGGMS